MVMEDSLNKLHDGAILVKVRRGNKFYNRNYRVDKNTSSIVAESKKWWSPGALNTGGQAPDITVPLIDVVEIREGYKTDAFNKLSDKNEKLKEKGVESPKKINTDESRCFSIIYGPGGREVLDLIASSEDEKNVWVSGLRKLVEDIHTMHQDKQHDLWLMSKFRSADKDKNGSLSLDEIFKLLTSLNLKLNKKHTKALFLEANRRSHRERGGEKVLDAEEFVDFYYSLLKMPEIEALFVRYSNNDSKAMNAEDLLKFLKVEQNWDATIDDAKSLIEEFEPSNIRDGGNLSYDGFYHMLLSEKFNAYNINHQNNIHQNMDQPLCHYYISSSHNTYLTGHQLAGESSVEGYISALKKGCRVVELDVWDGDDGEPIIYHGHTLTTKISLADVLTDGIKPYAFVASPYPVILSIENHLSIKQQVVMVNLIKKIFGDMLMGDSSMNDVKVLPSPTELKNKIIIKAKKPKGSTIESDDEDDDSDTIEYIDNVDPKKDKPHKPLAPELRDIVNVCEGKKFQSFDSSFKDDKCVYFPSLRENKAKSLIESRASDFIKFTQRQISKIYPLGTRTSSSNLKPYPFWSVGAQVVTLNMQTEDKANFYNEALFRSNGNCGYVLKPNILLGKDYDPDNPQNEWMKTLRVRIISAQNLPSSENKNDVIDPYIYLKVRGSQLDYQKHRTRTIKNNGFNPVWNEAFELRIRVPQVSLIYFTVRDESSLSKDPVLALACIPFGSLKQGYNHVHLTDITGKTVPPAALFIHVGISE